MKRKTGIEKRAFIRNLYEHPVSGPEIEAMSFEVIDREAGATHFDERQWQVVRRMVHTSADLTIMDRVRFSEDAIDVGTRALEAGRPLYVDSNMMRSGISIQRLREACSAYDKGHITCHVADPDVARLAERDGLPRAVYAVRKAMDILQGAIVCFGNSPVGLLEVNRLIIEEGLKPALVIGMPVGFVHVTESKEELMRLSVPSIVLEGRRGGSALAVSVIHGLCGIAAKARDNRTGRETKHV